MRIRRREQFSCCTTLMVVLGAVFGYPSTYSQALGVVDEDERASQGTRSAAGGEATPNTTHTSSASVVSPTDRDGTSAPSDSGRTGEPAFEPRRFTLASYRESAGGDRMAGVGQSPAPADHWAYGGASSLAFAAFQNEPGQKGGNGADAKGGGDSLEDINNKLNNPGANLASLNFKLSWDQFQGSLGGKESPLKRLRGLKPGRPLKNLRSLFRSSGREGASSQNALTLNFQPVFPFKLDDDGTNILVRPSFPIVWKPHYNANSGGFDEQFGMGDAQLIAFYAKTDKETGFFWGVGPTFQFPTHTDDVLGNDAFMVGPAAYAGFAGKWGAAGLFPQHWWNIGGGDGYSAFTATQAFYWFSVGGGYQIGGAPIITYNWAIDDSDNALTVPVNLGVAKTIMIGKTPIKLKFEAIYYAVTPDDFGPQWGLQFTMTPVIANPFEKLGT